ncbi:class I SAM-dependent methyltransferase [Niabella insulamsoli]|uniref:class I SAM-dependent methyltransferase n=1 Tax=Niabella insulamsoli TaxID=3144874 RepID=UPI0031FCF616
MKQASGAADIMNKSSIGEIQARFDKDVDRFSSLDSGQVSVVDAAQTLALITEAYHRVAPHATELLDLGCGAGNYTLKMLQKNDRLNCTLVDLSAPMLRKAQERISAVTSNTITALQGDLRSVALPPNHFDIILAGAVLHHLRDDSDWETTFEKLFQILKPGGCLMIADLVTQEQEALSAYTWERYGDYLENIDGPAYRKHVLAYIEKEDSPRPVTYQLELMKRVGFRNTDILHKNICFAAFCGIK